MVTHREHKKMPPTILYNISKLFENIIHVSMYANDWVYTGKGVKVAA